MRECFVDKKFGEDAMRIIRYSNQVSVYLDKGKVLHPWAADGGKFPAGMSMYITRGDYDRLTDARSMAFKRRRSGVKA